MMEVNLALDLKKPVRPIRSRFWDVMDGSSSRNGAWARRNGVLMHRNRCRLRVEESRPRKGRVLETTPRPRGRLRVWRVDSDDTVKESTKCCLPIIVRPDRSCGSFHAVASRAFAFLASNEDTAFVPATGTSDASALEGGRACRELQASPISESSESTSNRFELAEGYVGPRPGAALRPLTGGRI